jgi:hypothetical protein
MAVFCHIDFFSTLAKLAIAMCKIQKKINLAKKNLS